MNYKTNKCLVCGVAICNIAFRCKKHSDILLKNRTGKNNPNYKHGKYTGHNHCPVCGISIDASSFSCIKHRSDEWKKAVGAKRGSENHNYIDGRTMKPNYCIDCGKQISYNSQRCDGCKFIGENSPNYGKRLEDSTNWKGGRTSLHQSIRKLKEYIDWQKAVYERDNYLCQDCFNTKGSRDIVAHHTPIPFCQILAEFLKEYDQFSPIDDSTTLLRLAMKYKPFWVVSNGITLCPVCHKKIPNRKKTSEKGVRLDARRNRKILSHS